MKTVYLYLLVGVDPQKRNIFDISPFQKKEDKNKLQDTLYKTISDFITSQLNDGPLFVVENQKQLPEISSRHKHYHPGLVVTLEIDESYLDKSQSEQSLFPDKLNAKNTKNPSIKVGTKIEQKSIKSLRSLNMLEYRNSQTTFFVAQCEKVNQHWGTHLAWLFKDSVDTDITWPQERPSKKI